MSKKPRTSRAQQPTPNPAPAPSAEPTSCRVLTFQVKGLDNGQIGQLLVVIRELNLVGTFKPIRGSRFDVLEDDSYRHNRKRLLEYANLIATREPRSADA